MNDERTYDGRPSGADPFAAAAAEPAAGQAPAPAAPAVPTVPAGWYPDPAESTLIRWWDGVTWTDHRAPAGQTLGAAANPTTAAPPKRRSLLKVALGTFAVLMVLGIVASGLTQVMEGVRGPSDPGEVQFHMAEPVPTTWTAIDAMSGAASVAHDPTWTSLDELVDLQAYAQEMNGKSPFQYTVDGAWMSAGDMMTGAETITVVSTTDVTGAEGIRDYAEGVLEGSSEQFDSVLQTSAGVFETSGGQRGYLIRFEAEQFGVPLDGAIGVVASAHGYTTVQHFGGEHIEPGQSAFEAMLNSIELR